MKKIDATVVQNIYVAYVNYDFAGYYVQESTETIREFAQKIFEELKTENENCKSIEVYPYGDPEACEVVDYYHDDEEGDSLYIWNDEYIED